MSKPIKETPANTTVTKHDELLSRRSVLRGALMVGCSLLVPAALYHSSPALADSGVKKQAQSNMKYQSSPKGASKCGECVNFIAASGSCKLVEGKISPNGWCMLWAKKG